MRRAGQLPRTLGGPRQLVLRDYAEPVADERDIELVLVTGAGASCELGVDGNKVAAMKDWADYPAYLAPRPAA